MQVSDKLKQSKINAMATATAFSFARGIQYIFLPISSAETEKKSVSYQQSKIFGVTFPVSHRKTTACLIPVSLANLR